VYCPNAEAGLAVCEDTYHPAVFNYIVYMASSGGLSVPESNQRMNYYGMGGIPDLYWDGYFHIVGAGPDVADGSAYFPIIADHNTDSVPIAVGVSDWSFEPGSAFVEVKVKLFDDLPSVASHYIRVALVEDHLQYGGSVYHNVLRDMFPGSSGTPLTIQNAGEEQVVNLPFTMGAWDPDELLLIAWVQRDTDRFIYNSSSSGVGPYAVIAAVDGPQQQVADAGAVEFGAVNILNVGTDADTFDVTLDTGNLPEGWDAHFDYDGQDVTEAQIALDSFADANLTVTIDSGAVGSGHVVLNIFSQGAGEVVESLEFVALAGGTDILVIADDGGAGYADEYVSPSIAPAGKTWAVWDNGLAAIDGATLADYDGVVWVCGEATPSLTDTDRAAIDEYLAGGGSLLLTGQDIAEDLQNQGGSARLWFQFKTRTRFLAGNSNETAIFGEPGDEIGDGLSFDIAGGDGADNQTSPDVVEALTTDALPVFHYGATDGPWAGTRIAIDGYKLVYLGFGFEGIATQADRDQAMGDILGWLVGTTVGVEDTPQVTSLLQNHPNPFNPQTEISFALDRAGPARLAIFDVQGRLVRTLVDGSLPAGPHAVVWDGRSDAGRQAASGTYFYRLRSGDQEFTRKMTMVK